MLDARTVVCPTLPDRNLRLSTAMSASNLPPLPEVMLGPQPVDQPKLHFASDGVQRCAWNSACGAMLIEVGDG